LVSADATSCVNGEAYIRNIILGMFEKPPAYTSNRYCRRSFYGKI